ncbi:hypothetical protein DIURU_001995 [Diutina rugosa]|uniref:Uncharacterized protein n=1 Tax=Diutina rugosa TaxID=5481 RepID=A0A642URI5_DIURU|nr:uncharacterized protein DIURU_001995 [Diutina rugosa]KAA8904043.1 hypothetical protein DIURU_001995 [Diutina rugosa]
MSDIQQRIDQLEKLVEKQGALLAKTGQQLVQLQVSDVKARMKSIDDVQRQLNPQDKSKGVDDLDLTDYVTNEDLIQMVGELQGQLDGIEDRSIRRVYNSTTKGSIAPLSNRDGEQPTEDLLGFKFPATVAEFEKLPKIDIIQLALFYEVLVPDTRLESLAQAAKSDDPEAVKKALEEKTSASALSKIHDSISDADLKAAFDDVARYLGLPVRKGEPNQF